MDKAAVKMTKGEFQSAAANRIESTVRYDRFGFYFKQSNL